MVIIILRCETKNDHGRSAKLTGIHKQRSERSETSQKTLLPPPDHVLFTESRTTIEIEDREINDAILGSFRVRAGSATGQPIFLGTDEFTDLAFS